MLVLNGNPVVEVQIAPVASRDTENGNTVSYRDIKIITKKESTPAETLEIPRNDPDTGFMVDALEDRLKSHKVKVTFIEKGKKRQA